MFKHTCPIGLEVCSSLLVQDMERLIKRVTLNSCPAGLVFTPGPWIRGTLEHLRNKKNYIHIIQQFLFFIYSLECFESYLVIGEKMLSPALNFLMVPPALNQLCLFLCWAFRNSLLRCFHWLDINVVRILGEDINICWCNHYRGMCSMSRCTKQNRKTTFWAEPQGRNNLYKLAGTPPQWALEAVEMLQLSHFLSFATDIVIYYSPGPSRYWDSEKRRRRMIGSVLVTFHADATSSCKHT